MLRLEVLREARLLRKREQIQTALALLLWSKIHLIAD